MDVPDYIPGPEIRESVDTGEMKHFMDEQTPNNGFQLQMQHFLEASPEPTPKKEKKPKKPPKIPVKSDRPPPDKLPRKFISEFIEMYKLHECLWKPHSPNYTNRKIKAQAYQKLVEKYKEVEPAPNKKTVLRKIGSLRTTFRKEYLKVQAAKKTWLPRKPKLWYYESMLFTVCDPEIEDVLVMEDGKATTKMKEEVIDEDYEVEPEDDYNQDDQNDNDYTQEEESNDSRESDSEKYDPLQNHDHKTSTSRDHKESKYRKRESTSELNATIKKEVVSEDVDEHFLTGQTIAAKLKKMSTNQQIIAEKLIFDVLYYGRLEKLDTSTTLRLS